jgi:hypothetical protein
VSGDVVRGDLRSPGTTSLDTTHVKGLTRCTKEYNLCLCSAVSVSNFSALDFETAAD